MTDVDKTFAGSIPKLYDEYLVPLIFESFASDLAGRVAALAPKAVLEIAAAIAHRHGRGSVSGKIQGHVVVGKA